MQIAVENLGKRFNREWIFRNLTATFESGQVFAIVGPNGSGKSTLLQILWGQLPPSAGTIRYTTNKGSVAAEDVYQHLVIATPYMELIEEFTLREMVDFHFRFKSRIDNLTTDAMLARMELEHAADKYIRQFSSGMRQRLKLALAFYSDVEVIFLDEPTTNLDQKATDWYLKNLESVTKKLVFIASNQSHEYPASAQKLSIMDYKARVTTQR